MARKKGSRNKGFWFRPGRGWYATGGKTAVPLRNDQGQHIKRPEDREEAKHAYARYLLATGRDEKRSGLSVLEACQIYLDHLEATGAPQTYRMRAAVLFDLCAGYPARFRGSKVKPTSKDRIHPGLGAKTVAGLTSLDIEKWLKAHPGWKNTRVALQAVRRALNYCKESRLIAENPVKLKLPKVGCREAYIAPEVEQAIYRYARPALALMVKVCILTGSRPKIEFASLQPRHVKETPRGQCWEFPAREAKGRKKRRTIYVPEEVAAIVRERIKKQSTGPVFRNESGNPWTQEALRSAFKCLRGRLRAKGITVDDNLVPYCCRHTYAKRMLGGYWGPPVTLEVLAGLMGNTPQICWDHYAKWSNQYTDPFWAAIQPASRETSSAGS